jgi:DNA-binding transcriptional MocR family regulator
MTSALRGTAQFYRRRQIVSRGNRSGWRPTGDDHAIETGVVRAGDPLPTLLALAQDLVVSPSAIVKAYDELDRAFVAGCRPTASPTKRLRALSPRVWSVRCPVSTLRSSRHGSRSSRRRFPATIVALLAAVACALVGAAAFWTERRDFQPRGFQWMLTWC